MTRAAINFVALLLLIGFAGCKPDFDMAVYENSLYSLYAGAGSAQASSLLDQSVTSSELVSAKIPPGVYADRGILLYQAGNSTAAVHSITKEGELYPESKQFAQRLLALIRRDKAEQDLIASNPEHRTPSILILLPVK